MGRTLTDEDAKVGAVLRAYDINMAMDELRAGSVDAVTCDCGVADCRINVKEGRKEPIGTASGFPRADQAAFALNRKAAGPAALLNAGLKQNRQNGGCDTIIAGWIDSTSPLNA